MIDFSVRFDTAAGLTELRALAKATAPALDAGAHRAAGALLERVRAEVPKRSGRLARSFGISVPGPGSVEVGSSLAYAGISDQGGVVRARGRALAIPLPGTRARSPREAGPLRPIPISGGRAVLAELRSRKTRPLFLLQQQVQIPGKHFVERAAEAVDVESVAGDDLARRLGAR